jgi:hypothetical protein
MNKIQKENIYNIIFKKEAYSKQECEDVLEEANIKYFDCEETDDVICYTINKKEDLETPSILLQIEAPIYIVIKDVGLETLLN